MRTSPANSFGDTIADWVMGPLIRQGRIRLRVAPVSGLLASVISLAALSWAAPASNTGRAAPQQISSADSPLPVFEFHSGFWVNLHHFLYLQARFRVRNSPTLDSGRGAARPTEVPISLINFPAAEIQAWQAAVSFYDKDLARRDLLLNGDMETINNRLAEMEACTELA